MKEFGRDLYRERMRGLAREIARSTWDEARRSGLKAVFMRDLIAAYYEILEEVEGSERRSGRVRSHRQETVRGS